MTIKLTTNSIYRLPWNLTDNAITWLEPTSKCNLYCDGCYRENRKDSHKTVAEIQHELEVFKRIRRSDCISIAGGEPLTHPEILEIVRMIKIMGWKPIVNTNGALLTKELLKELKKAGTFGFTFHVDSGQSRPDWKSKNEIELNELRTQFAEMLAAEGNLSCSFNATIYPENLEYIPAMVKWAQDNIDKVHVMVFIIYRMAILGKGLDFYVGKDKVYFDDMMYSKNDDRRRNDINTPEVVELINSVDKVYRPAAFLNGTEQPESYKWLLSGRIGNKKQIFGYIGPKFMELVQTFKHIFTGSYLAYSEMKWTKRGRVYFLFSPFDKGVRSIIKNYFKALFTNPAAFFKRLHYQTVLVIQPADIMQDGRVNMCDGCPDITIWNDRLVWSCRMEEQYRWGQNVRVVPQNNEEKSD